MAESHSSACRPSRLRIRLNSPIEVAQPPRQGDFRIGAQPWLSIHILLSLTLVTHFWEDYALGD